MKNVDQGAKENIYTLERGSNRRLEKIEYCETL